VPKTVSGLFERICSFEELYRGFREARKGKRYKEEVLRFSEDVEENVLELSRGLERKEYEPLGFKEFMLYDPKQREICAPFFRDRVVHWALYRVLEPLFDRKFIYDSYACRTGKGGHAAVDRLQEYMRKRDVQYYLQCDVEMYFDSIDHDILVDVIARTVADQDVLWLVRQLLAVYSSDRGVGKGLPIGTLYSQLFSNAYLNPFDHFVKQSLRVPYYIRYMDDFVLLSDSTEELHRWREAMQGFSVIN